MFHSRYVSAPTFLSCGVIRTLTRRMLELKPYPVPVTIRILGSNIPTPHTSCFDLIAFLVDAEPEARYGLPRCPAFRRVFCVAFYGPYWPYTKKLFKILDAGFPTHPPFLREEPAGGIFYSDLFLRY